MAYAAMIENVFLLSYSSFIMTLPGPLESEQESYFGHLLDVPKQAVPELGSFHCGLNDHQWLRWNGKTLVLKAHEWD